MLPGNLHCAALSIYPGGHHVKQLVEVCPVNIFARADDGALQIVEKNLDECTLCELCLNAAPPGTVKVKKLYGARAVLVRRN